MPVVVEDEGGLGRCERLVAVGEPDTAEELGGAGEAPLQPGHADEADVVSVVQVAQVLKARGLEPVGFDNDEPLPTAEGNAFDVAAQVGKPLHAV